jgi:uncharacterized protein involved in exopolysaccharide biosynthesis
VPRPLTAASSEREPQYLTLLQLCNDVLRRRWTVAALVVFCGVGATLLALARPRTYTSSASFLGEARQPLSDEMPSGTPVGGSSVLDPRGGSSRMTRMLAGGGTPMGLPRLAAAQPLDPGFYYTTLRSPQILLAVARHRFSIATATGERTGTAADFFELPDGPEDRRAEDAARRLGRALTVTYEEASGVLTLNIRTSHPGFSHAVAARLLDLLKERNRRMAEGRAQAQVAFLERAAATARQDLASSQSRLARFLESNRAFVPASRLATEFRRLDSDVLDKRQRHLDLALQLEHARLDRSRATQLVTVVVRPEAPSRPDPRGTVRTALAGAVGGGALAVLLVLIGAHLARLRAAGFADLSALETEWRAVRRRRRASRSPVFASAGMSSGSREDGS